MEFLKNVGGEIARSLDSAPQKDDKTEENRSDNASEENLPRIQDNTNNDSNKEVGILTRALTSSIIRID